MHLPSESPEPLLVSPFHSALFPHLHLHLGIPYPLSAEPSTNTVRSRAFPTPSDGGPACCYSTCGLAAQELRWVRLSQPLISLSKGRHFLLFAPNTAPHRRCPGKAQGYKLALGLLSPRITNAQENSTPPERSELCKSSSWAGRCFSFHSYYFSTVVKFLTTSIS